MLTLQSFNRWQAALIHLGLSILIAAVVVTLIVFLWYPPPYFRAMGGGTLLRLIITVDVILGPLFTLIVFDRRKPRLKLDLAIIGILQVAALAYGVFVMFEARPAWNVFVKDRFEIVAANAVDRKSLARAPEAFRTIPLMGPRLVAGRTPTDPKEALEFSMATMAGGADVAASPHLFVPLTEEAATVAQVARPLAALSRLSRDNADVVSAFAAANGKGRELGFVPVRARNEDMAAVVDKKTGEVVGFLPLNPW